jgi:hypothetical protein
MVTFKFFLKECVRKIGQQEVRTVEDIHEMPVGQETLYHIQLGSDFATRVWAKESELERVSSIDEGQRLRNPSPDKPAAVRAGAEPTPARPSSKGRNIKPGSGKSLKIAGAHKAASKRFKKKPSTRKRGGIKR